MSDKIPAYAGDDQLGKLLRAAGALTSLSEVKELLAGVAAAPRPLDDGEWLRLVVPAADGALRGQLVALREKFASANDGIGQVGVSPARLADLRAAFATKARSGVETCTPTAELIRSR